MIEYDSRDTIPTKIICYIDENGVCGFCGDSTTMYTVYMQLGNKYILKHSYYAGCRGVRDDGIKSITKDEFLEEFATSMNSPHGVYDYNGEFDWQSLSEWEEQYESD